MLAIDDIDLLALSRGLHQRFGESLEANYLDGRTLLRDAVATHLGCSDLEAEGLVDTLEAAGYIRFPEIARGMHSMAGLAWRIRH